MRITVGIFLTTLIAGGCSDTAPTESSPTSPDKVAAAAAATGQTDQPADAPETGDEPSDASAKGADPEPVNPESTDTTVEQIQGRWVIVEASLSGQVIETMKGSVAEISEDKITIAVGGQKTEST